MSARIETESGVAVYRRLLGYVGPYWKVFLVAVLAMAVYATTEAGFAALMKPLLDGSFVERDPEIIRLVPILLIGIFLVRTVSGFLSSFGMSWIARHVIRDLREQLFGQLLRLPTRFYDNTSSGAILSKILYDVEQVANASSQAITILVRDTLTVIALLAWMAYLSGTLTLVFLVIAPFVAVLVAYVSRRFRKLSRRIQGSMADVTHVSEENIEGQQVVKVFGGEAYESKRFGQVNNYNRRQHLKREATNAFSVPFIQLLVALAFAVIIYLATLPEVLDSITAGTFMSFMTAMVLLMQPTRRLTTINVALQQGIAGAQSIFAFLDQDAEEDRGTKTVDRARGAIEYQGVSFAYDPRKGEVLQDIDLRVEPGQTVAFVGRSGGGKSTLVSLLPRFYSPTRGRIKVDGVDIRELRLANLRRQIALVSQRVTLFNDTIRQNIAYGALGDASEADILQAAETAHALDFIRKLPDGLDTMVGENGVMLSGGQRQRIAIARALLKDAPILILDEATSALDTESERHIQAGLEALMRGRTTLVIAHRLSTIEGADLIVVLENGRVVEQGGHTELLARNGAYAGLYNMQFHESHDQLRLRQ